MRINKGDIVRHFKHGLEPAGSTKYMYKVVDFAINVETGEKHVVYSSLYSDSETGTSFGDCFVRPLDIFMSEVDHEKYPNISQKYRFEKVG